MNIDKSEVLRYLGCGSSSNYWMQGLIDECILEINECIGVGVIYNIFNIEADCEKVKVTNSDIELKGKDISKHLEYSPKCAIMAATLGIQVDNKLRYYKKSDIAKATVFDACASAAIESVCDMTENEIKELASSYEFGITSRYSPGYGDFHLKAQAQILNALNASIKIGLTVTENCILLPSKSVTAIIGFTKQNTKANSSCENCNIFTSCAFRKGGRNCGH